MRKTFLGPALVTALLGITACDPQEDLSVDDARDSEEGARAAATATANIDYIGLGDSIAYGQNSFVPYDATRPDESAFVGFTDVLGQDMFADQYVNVACPGETTASFADPEALDNGCRTIKSYYVETMHTPYWRTQQQVLDELLMNNDVKLITISLGGNDFLLGLDACTALHEGDQSAIYVCAAKRIPEVIRQAVANMDRIFQHIRQLGYEGELVFVNQYPTDAANVVTTGALRQYNDAMLAVARDHDVKIADVFASFVTATEPFDGDACAAGLLIPNPKQPVPEGEALCDHHPSVAGRELIANAVRAALARAR